MEVTFGSRNVATDGAGRLVGVGFLTAPRACTSIKIHNGEMAEWSKAPD